MSTKRIFITGGGSGLGKAIALRFARAGYRVAIGDIHQQRSQATLDELKALGIEALSFHCDVTRIEDLEHVRDELLQQWQGVDIVVNNAGVAGTVGGIATVSLDDWQWALDINLLGVVRGSRVFTPVFQQQGQGYFVNIASAAGLINAPMMAAYNVSKAGIIALSETLSVELAADHIGISVVCPAFFKTNLTESLRSHIDGMAGQVDKLMHRSGITAAGIAQRIFAAVEKRKFWVVTHAFERRLWYLKRWSPGLFRKLMLRQMRQRQRR